MDKVMLNLRTRKGTYVLFVMMAALVSMALSALPAGAATFSAAVSYGTGTAPSSTAVGDFNADGIADLATANFGDPGTEDGAIAIRLGSGAGAFQTPVRYSAGVGVNPDAVIAADVNGDGKLDLVTANLSTDNVSVLLGSGTGTFGAAVTYGAARAGGGPIALAAGDLNKDGKIDVVTANSGDNSVSVLLGNGTGGFTLVPSHIFSTVNLESGRMPVGIAVGDFNRDGNPDVATANAGNSDVSILLGNGIGDLGAAAAVSTSSNHVIGQSPMAIVAADFNADTKIDLATANNSDNVSVLIGKGDGAFQAAALYAAGTTPAAIAGGDFDGDGKPDLAVANSYGDDISYFRGNGNGSFQNAVSYAVSACVTHPCNNPFAVLAADVNGNGGPDLVVSNNWSDDISILADILQVATSGISGVITDGVKGVKNVTVKLSSGAVATTDVLGAFSFTGLANGEYTVTPSRSGQTFTPASASVTLMNNSKDKVSFVINPVMVATTAGANGAISPQGPVPVRCDDSQTFVITPNSGYHVEDVKVNGVSIGAVTTHTLANVDAPQTVSATFALNTYAVTAATVVGGSVSGGGQSVSHGATTSFTVTPDAHYHLVSVTGCNGQLSGNTFTTSAVTGACAVTATFALPDGDMGGGCSVGDALKALKIAAAMQAPTGNDLLRGDVAPLVNGKPSPDGKIDLSDAVVILRKAVGLVNW